MDNLVSIYYGGTVERDRYGYVELVDMQSVPVLFNERPSFSELTARAREEVHCRTDDGIIVDGVLHFGYPPNMLRKMIPIGCADQWDNYVRSAMKSQFQSLDVVVQRVLVDPIPLGLSPPMGEHACFEPPVLERDVDAEVPPMVPDAQSAPNDVAHPPQEIPLTQNHPRDVPDNEGAPADDAQVQIGDGIRASNSVEIMNDSEPYEIARAVDSDDDRPVGELTESDVEMLRRIFPGRRDPLIHEFSDLTHSDQAFAEGRDDELQEAPEAGPSMEIEKGRVFNDLPALKRWLQAFAVLRKRPFKVLHSYVERRYTVVCDKERCPWRVCARKQKVSGKWKITRVVGPHTCSSHDLNTKHRQLTSTLIAKRLMKVLQGEPNMKVRTIIKIVNEVYGGYDISYGKAWRAKQRAWKMIYGDWEDGYEQLPVLLNAIQAVNPGMHYEYIPRPDAWKDGRQIFFRAFWCFPQCVEAFRHCRPVFSIDGTFLIGKYRGTLLIAISCDANNKLVPLAFGLVERENNDSWGWFLRLVRIHVVGPGREVGVISDRHQGILHAVREEIEGYAPLHHRWCTRHLAENLLRKDGVKDNFDLFQEAARQLEDKYFRRKLEEVRTASNAEGRQWLTGLMRDVEKWTRAHDAGGWRYEFQCSNMAESFNKLLLGIRGMPVNAIVQFTFYKLVAWFNDRHAHALQLQSEGKIWAPTPQAHLEKAKERAGTHEVTCFDHATGRYEVKHIGGTTSDGEVRDARIHVVVLQDFSCTCGKPRQYHFVCSHLIAAARHRNYDIEARIPHQFSVHTLVETWRPRFVPFRDPGEWPPYDGPRYVADPAYRWDKRGSRKRTRHRMVMDQIPGRTRRGRVTPFLNDPEQYECGKCGRLGHNSRTCHWQISEDGAIPPSGSGVRRDPPRTSRSVGAEPSPPSF